ncbi:MAG: OmpP1/FadL family transporter [Desulfococcaceae bacterium]
MNTKHIRHIVFLGIVLWAIPVGIFFVSQTLAGPIEIPSSFNPVGSGARAIGAGGAFIAVADDATAASWNPAGLIQLRKPEFSVVTAGFYRGEDLEFGTNPDASGSNSVSDANINYLSAAWPFELFNHNMIVSVSYQHLFDFSREWDFLLSETEGSLRYRDDWQYEQSGSLSAVGVSYGVQVIPEHLSAGITFNFWEDSITDNEWKQKYKRLRHGFQSSGDVSDTSQGETFTEYYNRTESYAFSGFNMNIGFLWDINDTWRIGAVLKTPFTADIAYKKKTYTEKLYPERSEPPNIAAGLYNKSEELTMPMSYGIGVLYNYSENLFFSADVYKTHWDDFEYKDEKGEKKSPLTGKPMEESQTDPTYQVRMGAEYLVFKDEKRAMAVPFRCGLFYDPAPAENSPDDYYGFSVGSGFTLNNRFSLDMAWQFRYGNDVGEYILKGMEFSQDVQEHMLYLSLIVYLF